jgi:GT2 family glycosyltransferase
MMSVPKVSVILVNWNNFKDTAECLGSLKKVTYPNYEVVVVDNGSAGDDVSLLRQDFGNFVKLIENDKNIGFAGGCNIGIKDALARGADYVVLLNNDTVVAPDFLEAVVKVGQSENKLGVAGGKIYCYELPETIWFAGGSLNYLTGGTPIRGTGETDEGQFEEIAEVDWICGCYMFISREALQAVGMLDDRFFFGWEDVDFCVRAAKKGFKILFVPGSKIWHKGFGAEKRGRLTGMPVYYATRGQFLFRDKNFTRLQFISSTLCFFATFPKCIWSYSRLLNEWNVPLYLLWGIGGYLRLKFKGHTNM